jgi:Flp pilus assembly protein TadG
MRISSHRTSADRRGAAVVELAVLLPFLMFIFIIAVDWSRIFYYSVIVNNCARNGALYACDPWATNRSPYNNLKAAALADAPNLNPQPNVTTAAGVDIYGAYVDCTVTYNFKTITNYPGVPSDNPIVRTVRVYQAARVPK